MSTIEKMMALLSQPASNTASDKIEEKATSDETDSDIDEQRENSEQPQSNSKTYNDEELDKLLEEKKEEWKQEFLSKLPEKEKLQMHALSKDDEISHLKAQLAKRDLQQTVIRKLDEAKLPVYIEKLVQYSDEENTMKSLEDVLIVFKQAVNDGVNFRLRGKTPAGLGGAANSENSIIDPFSTTFAKALNR